MLENEIISIKTYKLSDRKQSQQSSSDFKDFIATFLKTKPVILPFSVTFILRDAGTQAVCVAGRISRKDPNFGKIVVDSGSIRGHAIMRLQRISKVFM